MVLCNNYKIIVTLTSFLTIFVLSLQMGESQQSLQAYLIEQQQVREASYPELKFVTDELKKKKLHKAM